MIFCNFGIKTVYLQSNKSLECKTIYKNCSGVWNHFNISSANIEI